jgi:TonB-linked SusC/RagA family outer membrane protein
MRKLFTLLAAIVLLCGQLNAQSSRTVKGKVTDDKGIPLVGVTVSAVGTNKKVTTDKEGNFSIEITSKVRSLQFSYVGFALQAVDVSNVSVLNVSINLKAEDASLTEVVVVGYGTQKRKEVTGSLATVKGSDVAQKPLQSFESGLAGKAAGVQITVPNGVLNNPPVFRIRGTNSISLSTYPLIVVDGIPTYSGDQGATSAPANALASINPSDIESIDIAKDAAASAIYGSRAANGVVFITTKKGKAGRARVTYDGWIGFTKPMGLPEVMNAEQYVAYKNVALANLKANNSANTGNFIQPLDANGKPINTNWMDEVYREGVSHSHSISVSGGNEGTTYYFSAGYTDQQGILRKNDFKRMSILLNVDGKINKVVTIGGKVAFSNEKNLIGGSSGSLPGEGFASVGAARLAFALPPNISPYNNDGTYNIPTATAMGGQGSLVNGANPNTFSNITFLLNSNRSDNEVNHLQSNVYIQLKPLNWITLKSTYGIDHLLIDNDIFYNPYHGDGATTSLGPGGGGSGIYSKDKEWLWTNTAQFDHTFANRHNVSLLVGNEQQRRTSVGFGISRRTLSDSAYTNVQSGFTTNNTAGLALGKNYLTSNFARMNYNFDKKYYLSGSVRQDEYSVLGVKKGTFWAASGAWEIAQEKFWSSSRLDKIFSSFKLRGSYGKVGNVAGIGNYDTYSTYGSGLYGGTATLAFSTVGNDKVEWETSTKTDIGLSFSVLRDRISAEVTYYKNDIDGLILSVPQSPSTGLPNILQNAGTMYNKGIEFSLNALVLQKGAFTWNSSFNIAYNKNMVTSLANGLPEILTATSSLETVSKTLPGYSIGYLWVIRTGGIDPASGRRIFVDNSGRRVFYQHGTVLPSGQFNYSNPDGTLYTRTGGGQNAINQSDDAVLYANTQPKYVGGWDNTVRYKSFDLNFLFTYQLGFSIYYGSNAGLHDQRFWNNATDVLNYWQKPGDNAAWPKPVFQDNTSNGSAFPLDINVFKGDFVKLRTVQLGYSLPRNILDRAKISNARIYVAGQNLLIMTNYPGPDPEVSTNGNAPRSAGVDRNGLANGRTITIGLNVGF